LKPQNLYSKLNFLKFQDIIQQSISGFFSFKAISKLKIIIVYGYQRAKKNFVSSSTENRRLCNGGILHSKRKIVQVKRRREKEDGRIDGVTKRRDIAG